MSEVQNLCLRDTVALLLLLQVTTHRVCSASYQRPTSTQHQASTQTYRWCRAVGCCRCPTLTPAPVALCRLCITPRWGSNGIEYTIIDVIATLQCLAEAQRVDTTFRVGFKGSDIGKHNPHTQNPNSPFKPPQWLAAVATGALVCCVPAVVRHRVHSAAQRHRLWWSSGSLWSVAGLHHGSWHEQTSSYLCKVCGTGSDSQPGSSWLALQAGPQPCASIASMLLYVLFEMWACTEQVPPAASCQCEAWHCCCCCCCCCRAVQVCRALRCFRWMLLRLGS
jgi:hypothetical protein